ncbi:MAG: aldehyde dehydrogenase [Rhodospirillales bacterium]|nr:aldehyde dehydrogenase [Rhodospirillales bacterium]MBO6788239.1 aldehyde dehydrogenase [Rhodospirillales bacterium]
MSELQKYQMLIGGEWVDAAGGETFESMNPYTGENWATFPRGTADDVDRAVAAARKAFTSGDWPKMTATQRGHLLRKLGDLVAQHAEELAQTEVRDNGKLLAEMGMQLKYVPQWYYYFGGLADKIEGAVTPIDKPDHFHYTRHEPLGVVGAITPWNSPLLLAAWKLAPALAAGNTVVLKPSEFTSASSLEYARLFEEAGFPPGVVNVVTGFGHEVGAALTEHPGVDKITFTGGPETGRRVYQTGASQFKRVSLELGGKSPNIVFDDCDMENAVKGAISGIFAATGQTCIAGSRLLVQESIHDEFVDKLIAMAKTAKMGDPMLMDTQVGPVTTVPQYEKILSYIDVAKGEGAEVRLGGDKADAGKYFVQPTVFTGVNNKMRIAQEEVFGPILSVIPFKDEEEAIHVGNDVVYGLAAGVWTQNMRRAFTMSQQLRAGSIWVNTYRAVSYMAPFGGYKSSGLGRENGQNAIYEFMQTKSVWMSYAEDTPNPFIMR